MTTAIAILLLAVVIYAVIAVPIRVNAQLRELVAEAKKQTAALERMSPPKPKEEEPEYQGTIRYRS